MDFSIVKKEEYDEDEQTRKKVKTEEDIIAKQEEIDSVPNYYSLFASHNDPMTLDWRSSQLGFSLFSGPAMMDSLDSKHFQLPPTRKPFIIIRQNKKENFSENNESAPPQEESDRLSEDSNFMIEEKKKTRRASTCKNYVGLLCAGLSRTILTAEPGTKILIYMQEILEKKKSKFDSLSKIDGKNLMESLTDYIYKAMCGKKVRKSNRERDFKIRNTKDLQNLMKASPKDNESVSLFKEILKEMIEYFFISGYYEIWLENGMISDHNKAFFVKNKDEIQKKFLNPGSYKPKFQDSSNEEH